jgi:hypothetical protein
MQNRRAEGEAQLKKALELQPGYPPAETLMKQLKNLR